MSRPTAWIRTSSLGLLTLLVALPAFALNPNRMVLPCPDHEAEQGAQVIVAPPQGEPLTASERRVVHWLVREIHRLDGSKDEIVDFTADDVRRATGVDVESIDANHVREAVLDALDPESAPSPEAAASPAPDSAAPNPTPPVDPQTDNGEPGLPR